MNCETCAAVMVLERLDPSQLDDITCLDCGKQLHSAVAISF